MTDTSASTDRDRKHQQRMARKKAVVDEKVAQAQEERGVLILLRGNGKGKSSSAFGTLLRTLGHGYEAGAVQFIKGQWETGEIRALKSLPGFRYHCMGTGFTWNTQDRQKDEQAAAATWAHAASMLANPHLRLVVLDELTYMFKYDYLPLEEVMTALQQRPRHQSVIITGRIAPPALEELADTVSEVRDHKHAFRGGVKAQAGIEW